MKWYWKSFIRRSLKSVSLHIADKIHHGVEGVQYLDHKVLAQILEETEPDILRNAARLPG